MSWKWQSWLKTFVIGEYWFLSRGICWVFIPLRCSIVFVYCVVAQSLVFNMERSWHLAQPSAPIGLDTGLHRFPLQCLKTSSASWLFEPGDIVEVRIRPCLFWFWISWCLPSQLWPLHNSTMSSRVQCIKCHSITFIWLNHRATTYSSLHQYITFISSIIQMYCVARHQLWTSVTLRFHSNLQILKMVCNMFDLLKQEHTLRWISHIYMEKFDTVEGGCFWLC